MIVRAAEQKRFGEMAAQLKRLLESNPQLKKLNAKVDVVVTNDGMRIELIESGSGEVFFPVGSSQMKAAAVIALQLIHPRAAHALNRSSSRGTPTRRPTAARRRAGSTATGSCRASAPTPRAACSRRAGCPAGASPRCAATPTASRAAPPTRSTRQPAHLDPPAVQRRRRRWTSSRRRTRRRADARRPARPGAGR
jgi:hypothetical protein